MTQRGEEMATSIMTALTEHLGVTKAAGVPAELQLVKSAITPLCETIATYEEHVRRTSKELKRSNKILKAIAREPEQVPRGFMPYQPDQWRTQLTPNLPPRPVNGHAYPPGSENDRPN